MSVQNTQNENVEFYTYKPHKTVIGVSTQRKHTKQK